MNKLNLLFTTLMANLFVFGSSGLAQEINSGNLKATRSLYKVGKRNSCMIAYLKTNLKTQVVVSTGVNTHYEVCNIHEEGVDKGIYLRVFKDDSSDRVKITINHNPTAVGVRSCAIVWMKAEESMSLKTIGSNGLASVCNLSIQHQKVP